MAQSPTERIVAIGRTVDILSTRLEMLARNADKIEDEFRETTKELAEIKRNSDRELALLKRETDELKKWKEEVKKADEEWGRKLWMIVPPVAAVLVSNLLTILIMSYFKN